MHGIYTCMIMIGYNNIIKWLINLTPVSTYIQAWFAHWTLVVQEGHSEDKANATTDY